MTDDQLLSIIRSTLVDSILIQSTGKSFLDSCFSSAVHSDHVVLKNGGELPCGLVVWSTGLAPREFVTKLDIPKNNRGQVGMMHNFNNSRHHFKIF